MAYLEFEDDPTLEFEFYLAAELHMTVTRLRAEMPNGEFRKWATYHGRRAQQRELAERKR